jgi:hypothetical protein
MRVALVGATAKYFAFQEILADKRYPLSNTVYTLRNLGPVTYSPVESNTTGTGADPISERPVRHGRRRHRRRS